MDMYSYQVNILLAVNSCSRKYCLIVISLYKQADSLFNRIDKSQKVDLIKDSFTELVEWRSKNKRIFKLALT